MIKQALDVGPLQKPLRDHSMEIVTIFLALLVGVLGFFVGIAINTLADVMPVYRRPRWPQDNEGNPRRISDWSGLAVILKGVRPAQTDWLSWRHPVVEVTTGLIFGLVIFNWAGERPSIRLVIWLIYLSILMLITVIDIEHRLILFPVVIPASVVVLVLSTTFPAPRRDRLDYLIGGLVGFGAFWLMFFLAAQFSTLMGRLRGQDIEEVAFGFGDVMLAGLCGLMIGWPGIIVALTIAIFAAGAGAIVYVVMLVISDRFQLFAAFPYGPYIAFGAAIVMLWPQEIARLLGG